MTSFCPGYKDAALTYAVEQLAEKEGISFKKMIRRIENRTIPHALRLVKSWTFLPKKDIPVKPCKRSLRSSRG